MIISSFFSGEITSNVLRVAREARQRTLGPFSPSFNIQEMLLDNLRKVSEARNDDINITTFELASGSLLCAQFSYRLE
jgi:hypothetical protein